MIQSGTNTQGPVVDKEELKSALEDTRRDLGRLVEQLSTAYSEGEAALKRQAEKRPLTCLGVAFGIGFALGGGIFSRFMLSAATAGIRASLLEALPVLLSGAQTYMQRGGEVE